MMEKLPEPKPFKLGTNNSVLMPKATGENPSPRRVQEPEKIKATPNDKEKLAEAVYGGLVEDIIDTSKDQIDSASGLPMDSHGGIDATAWAAAAAKGYHSVDSRNAKEMAAAIIRKLRKTWEKQPKAILNSGETRQDVINHIKQELSSQELSKLRFDMLGLPSTENLEQKEWTVGTPEGTAALESRKIRTAIQMGATEVNSGVQIQLVKEAIEKQLKPEERALVHFTYFDPPKGSNIKSHSSPSMDELFGRLG